jgi:hypothetical protein
MRRFFLVALVLVLASSPLVWSGELIDGIVAKVNGHIILLSEWEDAIRFESFTSLKSADAFTAIDRKAVLDRLIDQELLREQIHQSDAVQVPNDLIDRRLDEIRKEYLQANDPVQWSTLLRRYGLTESTLRDRIKAQIQLLRLVDMRLRPGIKIDEKAIESYYNEQFRPSLKQQPDAGFAAVSPQIHELLVQQKMNEMLTAWLQNLRAGSQIEDNSSSSPGRTQ